MSTKKNVAKLSTNPGVLKKKVATKSKLSSRKREDSSDRGATAKTEVSIKPTAKPTSKDKKVDNVKISLSKLTRSNRDIKTKPSPNTQNKSLVLKPSFSKMRIPSTPPSSRVTKSQFFPSKSIYTHALKTNETPTKTLEVNKQKKSISLDKIKNNTEDKRSTESPDSSSVSERPRTATLRKGSIVNANIVGPDAPKLKKQEAIKSVINESSKPELYEYDDDFESYESDFEAYSTSSSSSGLHISGRSSSSSITDSTENLFKELKSAEKRVDSAGTDDERKLDSGNFELPDYRHKQLLDNIKESIEQENANIHEKQMNNPASLSDEGFEDSKSLQFINFIGAQEKYKRKKSAEIRRKRGKEILNMIRMDQYDFTLFHLDPVPYEKFIEIFGKRNTVQTSTQTGEDDVCEEVQTVSINTVCRWTQYPIYFSKREISDPDFWHIYKSDFVGVGCDDHNQELIKTEALDENIFAKFISSAGKLILRIQEESSKNVIDNIKCNPRDIPFSNGFIPLNANKDISDRCSIKCAAFANNSCDIFLTVHIKRYEDDIKSVILIWDISQSRDPKFYLKSFGEISTCSFGYCNSDLIFAGTNDGSILIWDLKKANYEDNIIKCPNFSTDIDLGHHTAIVAIESITDTLESVLNFDIDERQICSLDEDGEFILWNAVNKFDSQKSIILIKNFTISLKKLYPNLVDLKCTDFIVDKRTINNVYVSTNYGYIIKYQLNTSKAVSKTYVPEKSSEAMCMEICPFSPNFFLAGYSSGNINLQSEAIDRPLNILSNNDNDICKGDVHMIQWSRNKPFVIYSKDVTNTIHIWDLSQSDIFPVYSIPFEKIITCMKLSPLINHAKISTENSFMLLGTEDGLIYLHVMNIEHGIQSREKYEEDIKTFINYVNRL